MTTEVRNILLGVVVVCVLFGFVLRDAFSQDREAQKEALRLQATEFCAAVGQPPNLLRDAINSAIAQDPKKWVPIAEWWNAIVDRYEKLRCGDA